MGFYNGYKENNVVVRRSQLTRLFREEWWTPVRLAQEIYTLFSNDEPIDMDSALNIHYDGEDAALTIDMGDSDGTPIRIETGDFTVNMDLDDDGNVNFTRPSATPGGAATSANPPGGGGTPGKILSGGPGATYSVALYANGISAASTGTVTATQMQIEATETIPADTWTPVFQVGSAYFIQVPVWL